MGKPGRRQQRVADDQVGDQLAQSGCRARPRSSRPARRVACSSTNLSSATATRAAVSRSFAVSLRVTGSAPGSGVSNMLEDLARLDLDLRVRHLPCQSRSKSSASVCTMWQPKAAVERRLVGLHVEHVLDRVAEVPDARALEIVQRHSAHRTIRRSPHRPAGSFSSVPRIDRRRPLAHADGHAGELRHGAEIVVGQLHVSRGPRRNPCAASGCSATSTIGTSRSRMMHAECGRRGVGHHVAEDQVELAAFNLSRNA